MIVRVDTASFPNSLLFDSDRSIIRQKNGFFSVGLCGAFVHPPHMIRKCANVIFGAF